MKTYSIPHTDLIVSSIAYGGLSLGGKWDYEPVEPDMIARASTLVRTAYESGITLFDLADVYAFGKAETALGEVLNQSPGLRNNIVIQTKCGQRFVDEPRHGDPPRVDLSREHILRSVEGSLKRLSTDRVDILLLHMPDALAEPEEIARAFDELHRSGKVRYFGVSNFTADQIELLLRRLHQPLVVNQLRLGLSYFYPISDGLEFTLASIENSKLLARFIKGEPLPSRDVQRGYLSGFGSGTLDYCRGRDIQVQAYSPLRFNSLLDRSGLSTPQLKACAELLSEIAKRYQTLPATIALAWLMRHPAHVVPIIGTASPQRIIEACAADRVTLTREEWYALFGAAADIQSRKIT